MGQFRAGICVHLFILFIFVEYVKHMFLTAEIPMQGYLNITKQFVPKRSTNNPLIKTLRNRIAKKYYIIYLSTVFHVILPLPLWPSLPSALDLLEIEKTDCRKWKWLSSKIEICPYLKNSQSFPLPLGFHFFVLVTWATFHISDQWFVVQSPGLPILFSQNIRCSGESCS